MAQSSYKDPFASALVILRTWLFSSHLEIVCKCSLQSCSDSTIDGALVTFFFLEASFLDVCDLDIGVLDFILTGRGSLLRFFCQGPGSDSLTQFEYF